MFTEYDIGDKVIFIGTISEIEKRGSGPIMYRVKEWPNIVFAEKAFFGTVKQQITNKEADDD